jgi:hypothetical protein
MPLSYYIKPPNGKLAAAFGGGLDAAFSSRLAKISRRSKGRLLHCQSGTSQVTPGPTLADFSSEIQNKSRWVTKVRKSSFWRSSQKWTPSISTGRTLAVLVLLRPSPSLPPPFQNLFLNYLPSNPFLLLLPIPWAAGFFQHLLPFQSASIVVSVVVFVIVIVVIVLVVLVASFNRSS